MEHMPIESEKKAHKLLHVCEKRNMAEQGSGGDGMLILIIL